MGMGWSLTISPISRQEIAVALLMGVAEPHFMYIVATEALPDRKFKLMVKVVSY